MDRKIYGESSGGNKSEDDSNPPKFKKARYIWEVKGNYHLRNDDSKNDTLIADRSPVTCTNEELEIKSADSCYSHEDNTQNLRNHCCVESFLKKTEEIFDANLDSNDSGFANMFQDTGVCNSLPIQIEQNAGDEDLFRLEWHTRQMLRYKIENKLNAALEACFGGSSNNGAVLDMSDIVEEAESDQEIKDEGILMAIESHGLKTNDWSPNKHLDKCSQRYNYSKPSLNSENKEMDTQCLSPNSDCRRMGENVLDSSVFNINEENSNDFWNTAVTAAIVEKGLSHSSE